MLSRLRNALKRPILGAVARRDARERDLLPAGSLPPALWGLETTAEGHLAVGGRDVAELARTHGTPLQVVNATRLEETYTRFRDAFGRHWPRVEVSYSYKTNPVPGVLRTLYEAGAGAEVISAFELWLALSLGVPPERIIFNGPAKTEESLELAVSQGIQLVNVDGPQEIDLLDRITREAGRRQRVAVRVVTSVGWASQFGFPLGDGAALAAFERLRDCEGLEPCGLHVHLGTGIRDIPTYVQAVQELVDFSRTLHEQLGITIDVFDLGGGYGVQTVREYSEMDHALLATGHAPQRLDPEAAPPIEDYGRAVAGVLEGAPRPASGEPPLLVLEPGRAVTSSSQLLLVRVLGVKPRRDGGRNVILDGGKNVALPLGYELHEIFAAERMDAPLEGVADLYGPLCHPSDLLLAGKSFPRVERGDLFAVMDSGAYFVPNQMNFSNPRAAIVMVRDGEVRQLREREAFEDVVRLDDPALFGASEPAARLVEEG